ncbi:MAG: hypothetical protein ACYDEF_03690 [Methanosarcina sp.]
MYHRTQAGTTLKFVIKALLILCLLLASTSTGYADAVTLSESTASTTADTFKTLFSVISVVAIVGASWLIIKFVKGQATMDQCTPFVIGLVVLGTLMLVSLGVIGSLPV